MDCHKTALSKKNRRGNRTNGAVDSFSGVYTAFCGSVLFDTCMLLLMGALNLLPAGFGMFVMRVTYLHRGRNFCLVGSSDKFRIGYEELAGFWAVPFEFAPSRACSGVLVGFFACFCWFSEGLSWLFWAADFVACSLFAVVVLLLLDAGFFGLSFEVSSRFSPHVL